MPSQREQVFLFRREGREGREGPVTLLQAVHHSSYAVLQVNDVEVDSETELETAELEVRQELCVVDLQDACHRLELDDHALLDDLIDTIAGGASRIRR